MVQKTLEQNAFTKCYSTKQKSPDQMIQIYLNHSNILLDNLSNLF